MLKLDVIEPSDSAYASPVVVVPKPDGTWRFCVDYRKVNAKMIKQAYPLPRPDEAFAAMTGAQYFSTIDMASGYWQIEMDPEDKHKTAFTSHRGLYQFKVMPFGLKNAPAMFQTVMDKVLRGLTWQHCLVYIDDIMIFSKTAEEHIRHLDSVFARIAAAGLTVKAKKCHFFKQRVKYLGHIISNKGREPDPDKLQGVRGFPTPRNKSDVRAFLGLAGYYRQYIRNFAKISAPLRIHT